MKKVRVGLARIENVFEILALYIIRWIDFTVQTCVEIMKAEFGAIFTFS